MDLPIFPSMLLSAACKPLSMIISYLYIPIVLNYLGIEKYGVWSTILSILSWISYCDIGLGNGLRNKLTESLAKKDGNSVKIVSSAYAMIAIITLCFTLAFSLLATCLNWKTVFGIRECQESLAGVVIVSISFVAVSFILSICKNILYSLQKAAFVSLMELIVQLLNLLGVLIGVRICRQSNLYIVAIIYGSSILIVNSVSSLILYYRHENVRPTIHQVDFQVGKGLLSLGLRFFVIQICALILFTTDSVIISILYGAAKVTPYNTVNKLFSAIIGVYGALIAPVWSNVTKLKAENAIMSINNLLKRLKFYMIPFILSSLILTKYFRPLSALWIGQELDYSNSLIYFGCVYCILNIWCDTYAAVSNGLELVKTSMLVACIQAIFNIPLSIFMAKQLRLGTAGVLGGTVISMFIGAFAIPIIVRHHLKIMSLSPSVIGGE